MAFCTYCGTQLQEGVQHVCAASEAAAAARQEQQYQYQQYQQQRPSNPLTVDGAVFLQMFQNPLQAASYGADKVLNGVIGLCASVIAYLLTGILSFRSAGLGLGIFDSFINRSPGFAYIFKAHFLGGIFSLAAFIAAFALFGLVFGRKKIGFPEVIAKYGSIQILTAGGYLLVAILSMGSGLLGALLGTITHWITIVVTLIVSLEAFDVPSEKRFAYAITALSSYVAVDWLVRQILA